MFKIKNKHDKFNELKDELDQLKAQKVADEEYALLKKEYDELKYGSIKQKGIKFGGFLSKGMNGLGELGKTLMKDESRVDVKRIINPIIIKIFKELEDCKVLENHEQLILDPKEYTKVKARYYPKEDKKF